MFEASDVLAATVSATEVIKQIKETILNPLIILGLGVALVLFLYGVFQAIRGAASDDGRVVGPKHMLWGLFGLFIMFSAFGLMNLICNTIGC